MTSSVTFNGMKRVISGKESRKSRRNVAMNEKSKKMKTVERDSAERVRKRFQHRYSVDRLVKHKSSKQKKTRKYTIVWPMDDGNVLQDVQFYSPSELRSSRKRIVLMQSRGTALFGFGRIKPPLYGKQNKKKHTAQKPII